MGFGGTRGDHTNVLATPCLDNHGQTAGCTQSERDRSLLARVGFIIYDRHGVGIIKDWNSFGDPDAVLAKVDPGFALFVPLEGHHFITCIRQRGGGDAGGGPSLFSDACQDGPVVLVAKPEPRLSELIELRADRCYESPLLRRTVNAGGANDVDA